MKDRAVPVRDYLFNRYAEYGDLDSDFVFVNLWRGQRGAAMTYSAVEALGDRLRRATGIADSTWHALRHSYATRLLRSGVPIEVVAELLGHASPQTTKSTYAHLDLADYRRVLAEHGVLDETQPHDRHDRYGDATGLDAAGCHPATGPSTTPSQGSATATAKPGAMPASLLWRSGRPPRQG
ncbi:tyrosine-type recombinase/integrase [Nonomuraea sp. NEAU-A123]|nr:tyrosine-type recombinase/integrase [Nonomuraea sp. NEAU-A123]